MRVQGLRPAGVTLLQCAPPSRVTCTLPSEVPAQIMAALSGEGASAVMVPRAAGFSLAAYLPAVAAVERLPHRVGGEQQQVLVHRRPDDGHGAHAASEGAAALNVGTDRVA